MSTRLERCWRGRWRRTIGRGTRFLLVLGCRVEKRAYDYRSECRDKSEEACYGDENFFCGQHLFTLLFALKAPKPEQNAYNKCAQSDDKAAAYPPVGQLLMAASVKAVKYSKNYYQNAAFSEKAAEHVTYGFRRPYPDAHL